MTYLFFDTETTGVPKNYKAPSSDLENWSCRLVQLSWIVKNDKQEELSRGNFIVKPDGFEIPTEASDIHGITTEKAIAEGLELKKVVYYFLGACKLADVLVGHNVSYDVHVVGAEMIRCFQKDYIEKQETIDTMLASVDFCKIPGKFGFKWPKLMELHQKLFGCDFDNAHDSSADIAATEKCFWELKKRSIL